MVAGADRHCPVIIPLFDCIVDVVVCRCLAVPAGPSGGYLWRFSTGLVSTTTGAISGAVGLGVGSVKWVAGKSYDAGSGVISTTKAVVSKVPVPTLKKKPKKE